MAALTVRDEVRPGRAIAELVLPDVPERISLRELIRTRVREEVALANLAPRDAHPLLVQPTDSEAELNGYRLREARSIDWEAQAGVALQAFSANGFFVLVDGRQVVDLDEELALDAGSSVRFLRLVSLVGG